MKPPKAILWLVLLAIVAMGATATNVGFAPLAPIQIIKSDGRIIPYFANTDATRGSQLMAAFASSDWTGGNATMQIEGGDYTGITTTLAVPSNCKVIARGDAHIKLGTISATPFYAIQNADTTNGNTNIVISGVHLDGNNSTNTDTSKAQTGIDLENCSRCDIRGCNIEHFGRSGTPSCIGIRIKAVTDSVISGNRIDDVVDGINGTTTTSSGLAVTGNVITNINRDFGITFSLMNKCSVVGNVIHTSPRPGIRLSDSNDNMISGNVITDCGGTTTTDDAAISIIAITATTNRNSIIGNTVRRTSATRPLYAVHLTTDPVNTFIALNDFETGGFTGTYNDEGATGTIYFGNKLNDGTFEAATSRATLGLAIGTNVQAYDADLTTYAGITPSANVQTLLGAANYAAMRTSLSLVPGTDVLAPNGSGAALTALNASNVSSGTLAIANGGTGGTDGAAWARDAGYTNTNLAASTTYYFCYPTTSSFTAIASSANLHRLYITRACHLTAVVGELTVAGTLGSAHNSTLSIRKNDTTDTTVTSSLAASAAHNAINNTSLNISLAVGDFIELKLVTGAFTTAPTTTSATISLGFTN